MIKYFFSLIRKSDGEFFRPNVKKNKNSTLTEQRYNNSLSNRLP